MGVGGLNPMASLGTSAGSMGTMGAMGTLSPMSGVSSTDPLTQSYSSVSPYTGRSFIVVQKCELFVREKTNCTSLLLMN